MDQAALSSFSRLRSHAAGTLPFPRRPVPLSRCGSRDPSRSMPNMPGEFIADGADELDTNATQESLAQFIHSVLAYVWGGRDLRAVAPSSDSANFPGFFSILCSVFRDGVVTIFRVIS